MNEQISLSNELKIAWAGNRHFKNIDNSLHFIAICAINIKKSNQASFQRKQRLKIISTVYNTYKWDQRRAKCRLKKISKKPLKILIISPIYRVSLRACRPKHLLRLHRAWHATVWDDYCFSFHMIDVLLFIQKTFLYIPCYVLYILIVFRLFVGLIYHKKYHSLLW